MKKIIASTVLIFTVFISFGQQNNSKIYIEKEEENYKSPTCGGVERWSQKVLTDALANTINFTGSVTTIASLVNIVTPTPSTTMTRYPGIEDKTYSVTCNITIKKSETDNDYHLVLSDGVHTLIGEIPDPVCSSAASSSHVSQYIAARNFIDAHIASGNVFNVNIPSVVVYGAAFIDPPHGQTGAAPNNLEIHPILDIHFALTTDIKTFPENIVVNVFPNPVANKLNIQINSKLDNLNDCELDIYNAQGSLVNTIRLPKSSNALDVSVPVETLSSGMYIYRITKGQFPLYEGKFIKN